METPTPTAAKCARKANFSNNETQILLKEMGMERELLMSSFTNDVTNRKKRAAWDRILVRVNSCGVTLLSVGELRDKWGTLKRTMEDRNRDQRVTGGRGTFTPSRVRGVHCTDY